MKYFGDFILRILLITVVLGTVDDAISQCSISSLYGSDIMLEPEDEVILRLLVSDAVLSDLSDPQQGVCGVSLEFIHQDVTDLNFTLYSPIGNGVILIGPAEPAGGSLQLFGIAHDLTFIPSTDIAMPDAGMPEIWDNRDPDWGNNSAYAGSYYPFGGDLDVNFGNGSINGIWEIRLTDQFVGSLDPSTFQEFEITFCDEQLTCTVCESRVGEFTSDTLTLCEGQDVVLSDIYPTSLTDDSLYIDLPLSFSGDALFSVGNFPDFEGTYEVYVLNILATQEQEIRNLLTGLNKPQLIDIVNAPGGQFCMSLTVEPFIYNVSQNSGIVAVIEQEPESLSCDVRTITLDAAASTANDSTTYSWLDSNGVELSNSLDLSISEGGVYSLFISDDVCQDSTSILIEDTAEDLQVTITTQVDTLDCNNAQTILRYSASFEPTTLNWSNSAGMLMGDSDSLIVLAPDTYILSLQGSGDCSSADTIVILQNITEPIVDVTNDTITCDNSEITLRVVNPVDQISYEWFRDNVSITSGPNLSTVNGDLYVLEATAQNGCSVTQGIEVFVDTITTSINIPNDTLINCFNPVLTIPIESSESVIISQSIDGAPFEIIGAELNISSGGLYRYVVSFENGCFEEYQLSVIDNITDTTRLEMVSDTLTCLKETIVLDPELDGALFDFSWSPNLSNDSPQDSATESGLYEVRAQDKNTGCITTQLYDIAVDRDDPQEVVSGDTIISCSDTLVTLSVMTDVGAEVIWTSPDGAMTNGTMVTNSLTGIYEYSISGSNGCVVAGEWRVDADQSIPTADLPDEVLLNCIDTSVTLTIDTSLFSVATWDYNGVQSNGSELSVDTEGDISLELLSDNGCDNSYTIDVRVDRQTPDALIDNSDTTYCARQSVLVSATNLDVSQEVTYEWYIDDDLVSEQEEFLLAQYGVLTMIATNPNSGCSMTDQVSILLSDDPINSLIVDVQAESCAGDNNGMIDIAMVNGGMMPYLYQINNDTVNQVSQDLSPGDYDIVVIDDNNCQVDTTVTIADGDNVMVTLPADRVVPVDETIIVQSEIIGDYADLSWFINGMAFNSTEEELQITIDADQEVIIQLISTNGCVFRDTMFIDATFTLEQVELYIPNSFVRGDSGPNSSLYVSLPSEISSIDRFDIYDRWGNQVAKVVSPLGRARVEIWDGTYQNQLVNPGVYVYMCEVTTALDAQKKIFTGTLTLIN